MTTALNNQLRSPNVDGLAPKLGHKALPHAVANGLQVIVELADDHPLMAPVIRSSDNNAPHHRFVHSTLPFDPAHLTGEAISNNRRDGYSERGKPALRHKHQRQPVKKRTHALTYMHPPPFVKGQA
jgi:hypothetical protein